MSIQYFVFGFVLGAVVGIGGAALFLRWRLKRQLGSFQSDMEDLMDMTGDMTQGLDDLELDEENFEKEEKDE